MFTVLEHFIGAKRHLFEEFLTGVNITGEANLTSSVA
jgi:hypothetical protein